MFKTFALTIRPRGGVTDTQINLLGNWIKKHSLYYHVITEKRDESRHIHAALVLNKAVIKSNLCTTLLRLFPELDTEERSVLRDGVKVMYNIDWINEYLAKDDDAVVVESCLPEAGCIEAYFPIDRPKKGPASTDTYYNNLEFLWYKHVTPDVEVTAPNARDFLYKMMYSTRAIKIIRDDASIRQVARHLTRYIKKAEYCYLENAPFDEPDKIKYK